MSDYLFDREGDPDPEVERLESLLGPLAYRVAAPRLSAGRARPRYLAAAALCAIAAALVTLLLAKPWRPHAAPDRQQPTTSASWVATVQGGVATRDGHAITGVTRLPLGAWLETRSGRVQLAVADIGTVELAAPSRARIVATGPTRHELQLDHGALIATIDAPPRRFVVTTPRAVVTDLGCAFELTVDESGRGRLVVTAGQVAVSGGNAPEVVVRAGARVELSERGPGTPYTPDADHLSPDADHPAPARPPMQAHEPAPARPPAAKPPRHSVHTIPARSRASQPKTGTPPAHAQPARKTAPAPRVEHDPLKELERSVE